MGSRILRVRVPAGLKVLFKHCRVPFTSLPQVREAVSQLRSSTGNLLSTMYVEAYL